MRAPGDWIGGRIRRVARVIRAVDHVVAIGIRQLVDTYVADLVTVSVRAIERGGIHTRIRAVHAHPGTLVARLDAVTETRVRALIVCYTPLTTIINFIALRKRRVTRIARRDAARPRTRGWIAVFLTVAEQIRDDLAEGVVGDMQALVVSFFAEVDRAVAGVIGARIPRMRTRSADTHLRAVAENQIVGAIGI
jgi:hypothetical protein